MKTIIVDDERLARKELNTLLENHPEIEIIDEAVNADDALEKINHHQPDLVFLAGTAIFATTSHLCMARGLALVDVTVSQPIDFLQLVWSTMIGLIFFAESPVIWVWIGAGVVVFSATYMARLESRSVQHP